MLKSVRKTENGGYKTMTDAASTYVLCPRLWNQVSINFRGSEDNKDDGEQSKDVWVFSQLQTGVLLKRKSSLHVYTEIRR